MCAAPVVGGLRQFLLGGIVVADQPIAGAVPIGFAFTVAVAIALAGARWMRGRSVQRTGHCSCGAGLVPRDAEYRLGMRLDREQRRDLG
jgi:hypothetical protein